MSNMVYHAGLPGSDRCCCLPCTVEEGACRACLFAGQGRYACRGQSLQSCTHLVYVLRASSRTLSAASCPEGECLPAVRWRQYRGLL